MPKIIDNLPGSGLSELPWDEYLDGQARLFSMDEINELGVKIESLRSICHSMAAARGKKCRTRVTDEGLYIQAKEA